MTHPLLIALCMQTLCFLHESLAHPGRGGLATIPISNAHLSGPALEADHPWTGPENYLTASKHGKECQSMRSSFGLARDLVDAL